MLFSSLIGASVHKSQSTTSIPESMHIRMYIWKYDTYVRTYNYIHMYNYAVDQLG